jgi:predicted AlkP superfamily pyrophosphatase or phosphodiesterase
MNSRRLLPALMGLTLLACTRAPEPPAPASPPALIVFITVDQLRGDLLDHYGPVFTGGFRRLLTEGRVYVNATHDHARTVTATGHAALSTGVHPSRHGIVGNAWYERSGGERWVQMSNVGDSTVRTVGATLPGVSPRNLMSTGLADWMVTADPASLVASVSAKDRGAILPAAHVKGHVYWFEPAGGFVTSTYYRDANPEWVVRFNNDVVTRYMTDTIWAFTAPASSVWLSSPDTAAHESDGTHTYFPHPLSERTTNRDTNTLRAWMERTPLADAATIDFAEVMVTELGLGRDGAVDLLAVSVSQMDAVGHEYGPFSREQLDNIYRLDRRLGAFFDFLDGTVGRDRYIVGLSADHGVMTPPEDPRAMLGSRRLTSAERQTMQQIVTQAVAIGVDEAPPRIVAALKGLPAIADAWTTEELMRRTPSDSFAVLMRRSLYPGRAGGTFSRDGVEAWTRSGILGNERTGTTHGSPYWYDRHVPIIFMGPGVRAGRVEERVSTTDFAPTLASYAGVRYPRDLDGTALALR